MYHTAERMYNIAYYASQWLGIAAFCLYLTSLVLYVPPVTSVSNPKVTLFKSYRKIDGVQFDMDLDLDFTPSFNWNTKMIFVWVKASFETEKTPMNIATVWDTMIRKRENAHLVLKNEKIEYTLMDFGKELKGKTVNLTVEWMTVPWSGSTSIRKGNTTTFVLPEQYIK
ncbi:microsomal signal peptidase 23 kD subunit, putative [Entamoeba invadens IP1]|uniref:microsomal signal peptidase 23 kD subunit, putative n=1 Tax=Entamoeba invadens IP1 TaxID=370355 RepID=UPI0002C3D970|nr:microsomal signal peptidase 23 kD subunit, putative [Entamoeba invadens IP1]ELP93325.1 microsomal signal peptidase 23 kD subunit, putative [Entamoeba invadens IP1]|eukprot:XP_004260096.1 microsomal signal peptidase 23 kD subunit, putative [Entamoeba invadens IP1]